MEKFPMTLPLLFPLLWMTICHLLGWIGGWSKLSVRWANSTPPLSSPHYSSGLSSGSLGWVNYSSCLWYQLYPEALRLGVLFLFRIGHPTLLIPKGQITSLEVTRHWFGFYTVSLDLDGVTVKISTRRPAPIEDWWRDSGHATV